MFFESSKRLAAAVAVAVALTATAKAAPPTNDWTGFYIGANLAFPAAQNDYDDVKFASYGFGAGGQLGYRFAALPNWVVGAEVGGTGFRLEGRHELGAFGKVDWQAWQALQVGFTPSGFPVPTLLYATVGATQAKVTVGVDFVDFRESMTAILTGVTAGAGVDLLIRPNLSLGFRYQYSKFDGLIQDEPTKIDLHVMKLSINYQLQGCCR